jgi:NAD(P)H-nitrite reductase large subunit
LLSIETEQDDESDQQNIRQQVIIIGNGIAGISTAESIREQDSECRIILITREAYHFYNRMGLEKVLYGRTAMQGLYLMKKEWYERNDIDFWLNTQVIWIDVKGKNIKLGTGETVNYDKLVLATGAKAFVPEQEGYQLPGVFTLRSAEDALNIRSWVQQKQAKRAIVLGGGVLGVEAAEALLQLGLKVSLIHTDAYLMNRQLDKKSSTILDTFLRNKGIRVFTNNRIDKIEPSGEMLKVRLKDRKILVTDIILLCIGVRSDTELAKKAGLKINRGVVVDATMQTSNPDIFCVGDAAELPGAMGGLWSVGSDQGKVAANVLLGGDKQYQLQNLPAVQLKVSGIDLKSFGSFESDEDVESVYSGTNTSNRWCHVRVKQGHLVAGVFVNSPMAANAAMSASKKSDLVLSSQDIQDILAKDEIGKIS